MRIVVTLRETKISKIKETRESIDKKLISLLIKNGLTPILIPSELGMPKNYKKLVSFLKLSRPSGLLLSGGEDIKLNSARYCLERKLFKYFFRKNKKIFGICRGLQMISDIFQVGLRRTNLKVRKIYKIKNLDNKKHCFGTCYFKWEIKNCPKNFLITFLSENNTIWGIKHKSKNCEALMLHPEREKTSNLNFQKYIKNFYRKK